MKKSFKRLNDAVARGDRITGVPTGFDRYDKLTSGLQPSGPPRLGGGRRPGGSFAAGRDIELR